MAFSGENDLSLIYSPLVISKGIDVEGNVPASQEFDAALESFTPDYTLTHLTLQPWFAIVDPDGVLPAGRVEIANPAWSVIEGGVKTAITSSSTQYAVTPSGATAGRILVKRNGTPDAPLSLLFSGEYVDPRTGRLYRIELSHTVQCHSTGIAVTYGVDQPKMTRYDPVRETTPDRVIHPWIKAGGADVPAANRRFIWHKRDTSAGDTTYHTVGTSVMDYDVEAAADGSLTVHLPWIGRRIDLRCYCFYNPHGPVTDTAIKSGTRYLELTFLRHKEGYRVNVKASRLFSRSLKAIVAECDIADSKGIVPNPDTWFDIIWKTSTGKADGSTNFGSTVARGAKATIPVTSLSATYGGTLRAEATPKRPLAALHDASGAIITDASGHILLA